MVDVHKVCTQNYIEKKKPCDNINRCGAGKPSPNGRQIFLPLILFLVTCLTGIAHTWYFKCPITRIGSAIISDLMLPSYSRFLAHQLKKAAVCKMGSSILLVFSTSNILKKKPCVNPSTVKSITILIHMWQTQHLPCLSWNCHHIITHPPTVASSTAATSIMVPETFSLRYF